MYKVAKFQTFKGVKLAQLSFKSVAISATDLTINSVIVFVFERVLLKGHDPNGSDTLVLWDDSPLGYIKKKVLLIFFSATTTLSSKMIQQNRTTIWKDFPQYISKYMALKI